MDKRKYITGETSTQVYERYRSMFDGWEKLTLKQRCDRINRFRCGYIVTK